ncbi:MAG: histidine phosphatase family protein [Bacilli bacterium]|nr:MAG: histidine phosphatase family protein [Bacilli bacterium]
MTIVYLVRHSKPLKVNNNYTKDSLQIQNEKKILSSEGEALAEKHFSNEIFNNIDCVYSSNYIRAISTAKICCREKNNIEINIIDDLGERKFGINTWDELPNNLERKTILG